MEQKIFDKYSKSHLGSVDFATEDQVESALAKAENSFTELKKTSAGQRAGWLSSFANVVEKNHERLAGLVAAEAGKPISYARGEVDRSVVTLRKAAEECTRFGGEVIPMDYGAGTGRQSYTQNFPVGPVLGIAPFNFPLNLVLHKVGPALAVGNPIIIKPSLYTPLSAIALSELAVEAGIPAEAFQVVICSNELSEKMVLDERIKFFSFTGSPQVGWALKEKVPRKKVTLELGGNAAVIVDESADLEKAASTIATGAYLYAGQICISTQRIYVHESIYNNFLDSLTKKVEELKVGDPHDEAVTVGPLIDSVHLDRVSQWVEEARQSGAQILCGGEAFDEEHNLYKPTLIADTHHELKVVCEEVFGPVAVVEKFSNFSEAVALVNKSKFGLQAGVFTERIDHLKESFRDLEVGGVMINNIPGFRVDSMPYGGIKDSGYGREGLYYAMIDMTEPKLLVF